MDEPICTYLVIALTSVFSFLGFRNQGIENKYIFDPRSILAWKEYYRLITSAFLHSGWWHLLFNMLSLYWFGPTVEHALGKDHFLLIYFGAVLGGNLLSLYVHRHHEYLAYGASGGVCGMIFTTILMSPGSGIYAFPIPFPVPGWLFAVAFIAGSWYAMKANNKGDIGHDAHLGGAIVGFAIASALNPVLVRFHPWIFAIVLVAAIALLVYLWMNPVLLPLTVFLGPGTKSARRHTKMPKHRRESLELDAILEKIARSGKESLSPEEQRFLTEVSGKYQRRADSKKPESGLAI